MSLPVTAGSRTATTTPSTPRPFVRCPTTPAASTTHRPSPWKTNGSIATIPRTGRPIRRATWRPTILRKLAEFIQPMKRGPIARIILYLFFAGLIAVPFVLTRRSSRREASAAEGDTQGRAYPLRLLSDGRLQTSRSPLHPSGSGTRSPSLPPSCLRSPRWAHPFRSSTTTAMAGLTSMSPTAARAA